MTRIINIGSLNLDKIYRVQHPPLTGETVAASAHRVGLGGKGLNQSIAAARAGADVIHVGAVGPDGGALLDALRQSKVDTSLVRRIPAATGHAVILVNDSGDNSIVLAPGANRALTESDVDAAIARRGAGDILLLQNETNLVAEAIVRGSASGLAVAFNFAPFSPLTADTLPLDKVDVLFVNEIEGAGLSGADDADEILRILHDRYPRMLAVLTLGPEGACAVDRAGNVAREKATPTRVVETTAAGDTFIGFFLAELQRSGQVGSALRLGCRAGSLCVGRAGAAESIPRLEELRD